MSESGFDDFINGIGSLSPVIGTVIGGPVGGLIGGGIKLAAELITGESAPDAILSALTADPAKLQLLEEKAKELELTELRIRLEDVQNARKQTVELAASGSKIAWSAPVISLLIVCGFFGNLAMLFTVTAHVSDSVFQLQLVLMGTLGASFTQVVNYWLGSSNGSANKDSKLHDMMKEIRNAR